MHVYLSFCELENGQKGFSETHTINIITIFVGKYLGLHFGPCTCKASTSRLSYLSSWSLLFYIDIVFLQVVQSDPELTLPFRQFLNL